MYQLSYSISYQFFLTVCYHHVKYEFQSESTPYSLPECQGTPCSKQAPYLKFNLVAVSFFDLVEFYERLTTHIRNLSIIRKDLKHIWHQSGPKSEVNALQKYFYTFHEYALVENLDVFAPFKTFDKVPVSMVSWTSVKVSVKFNTIPWHLIAFLLLLWTFTVFEIDSTVRFFIS